MSPSWRKSSASAQGDCVEVALEGQAVLVRNSRERHSYVLKFTYSEWEAFLSGVHSGEFGLDVLEGRPPT
jgi:hypothetical protein